ncbi:ubiquitin-protein ligase E3A isoform X2 [Uranotaenia lowii]|uniref:ubiquitin-protein ligase E3A isoform X2 n=1 Tax=Uranotaenia lowii TaxID=190385 RepID=UPI0024789C82|nr:ubiquitin-protein ligase E3A isoform X2 [Uranotaenia lowii]
MNKDDPGKVDGDSRIDEESSSSSERKHHSEKTTAATGSTTVPSKALASNSSTNINASNLRSVASGSSKAGPSTTTASTGSGNESEDMKRASAKKLIERYFYQLVDGCGNPKCGNKYCASSGKVEKLSPNAAAARAIQLFTQEAELCEFHPSKMPKTMTSPSTSSSSGTRTDQSAPINRMDEGNVGGGNVSAGSSSRSSSGLDDSTVSTEAGTTWGTMGKNVDMDDVNESSNLDMDSMDEDEQHEASARKNQNQHYEGGGGGDEIKATSSPYALRSSTTSHNNGGSPFAGSSSSGKSSKNNETGTTGTISCRKKMSAPDGSSKDCNKKQRDTSPVDYLDEAKLQDIIKACDRDNSDIALIRTLGAIFSSYQSLAISFQKKPSSSIDAMLEKAPEDLKNLKKEDLRTLEGDLDKDEDSSAEQVPEVKDKHYTSVDLASLRRSISWLLKQKSSVFGPINNALQSLGQSLSIDLRVHLTQNEDIEQVITALVIVFEVFQIGTAEFLEVSMPQICSAVSHLPIWAQARLVHIWAEHCKDGIQPMLQLLQQLITISTLSLNYYRDVKIHDNEIVCNATKVMKIVFYANILAGEVDPKFYRETDLSDSALPAFLSLIPEDEDLMFNSSGDSSKDKKKQQRLEDPLAVELDVNILDCRRPHVPYEEFYNEPLCDVIEMDQDYLNYKSTTSDGAFYADSTKKFSFMLYSYILTPATKTLALFYDSRIRMYSERRLSILNQQLGAGLQNVNPFLKLKIRRDHIIDDALVELEMIAMSNPKDLKKQLVVEFSGEQGIDEGGVSKEFFQLIIEEIFNPDYGMFINNEDTNTVWFNSTSFENEAQFTLIGIVLGLAIYNNIILAVNFPMVVYRKLMGMKGSFVDLKDWNPILYNSLKSMLDYQENDMEEVFMQTFKICYKDVFGNTLDHELKPDGDSFFVNQDNKQEFVELYTDFLLNQSIEKQFRAFKRGFQMVTDESPLHLLFRPEEIELIVCGSKEFDFNELEQSTEYEGDFTAESQTIKDFWEIVHGLSMDSKRKLLQFTTGSDRVPVGGLSRLKLVIARNGPDCDRLPTSHTCFNVLLLPEYSSKEKLEERLLKAINYSKGFGML